MSENNVTPAPRQVTVEVGGRPLILETGKIAKQANGAIVARYGDAVVLTTACMASAACYCSDLPFEKPIAAVRVGLLDGQLVANPTVADQKKSLLNIVIAGTEDAIVMVESGALEVSEEAVVDALEFGHAQIKKIVGALKELYKQVNPTKVKVAALPFDEGLYKEIAKKYGDRLHDAIDTQKHPKKDSYHLLDALKDEIVSAIPEYA